MSSPASPRSPLPSVKPHETQSSTGQSQEGDTDWMEELDCSGYDDYIREDLNSRVFVDFYAFMKYVLHIPDDWKTTWGPAIEAVKVDPDFKSQYAEYCKGCDKFGTKEEISFVPSVNTANAALDIFSRSTFDGIPPISPHLVVLDKDCQPSKVGDPYGVNPLHVLEVKGRGGALCDGRNMPRLVVDGNCATSSFRVRRWLMWATEVDPIVNHALLFQPSRYATKRSNPLTESKTGSESPFVSSNSRKRPADRSSTIDQPPKKELRTKSASGRILDDSVGSKVDEDEGSSTTEPEIQRQAILAIRVCRYLLGMFSAHLLRSHATVTLVDRGRLQLYHANRSVILVSSTINLLEGDGLSKFIAVIIALGRPPFEQNSVLDTLAKKNAELVKGLGVSVENKVVEREDQLEFQGGESQGKFTVDLGDVISCRLATVGRSTVVLQATSDQWPKTELVVKISWPDSGRARESDFLEKASLEAEKSAGKWATKHLPRVFYTADVVFDENSALESVARLFKDAKFVNGEYVYERRTLRIIVQERLYPLKSLTNVRDVGQAFLDVACSTLLFQFSITVHSPHFSSPLALRPPWHPSSRPQSQQHHVPFHRGDERQRETGAESVRGSDRLRPFVVEGGARRRLHQNLAATHRYPALYGI